MTETFPLPPNLPVPTDDGACDHLPGMSLPSIPLASTDGGTVDLSALPGTVVVYCYPKTGDPVRGVPPEWDDIPGARGCSPQSRSFRELYPQFTEMDVRVYGLSTQTTAYQQEAAQRLDLPFPLLSDAGLAWTHALRLPTFTFEGETLIKRLTLVIRNGRIAHLFYPVFPPDENARDVLTWLRQGTMEEAVRT